ncbi:MAG TPA: hypothetical protein VL325_01450 [Pyrinomonadaceae bacterium]|jgi:hypothetical protein|nr:hypothetical protein [Pyrinomonadaceae bacterium]
MKKLFTKTIIAATLLSMSLTFTFVDQAKASVLSSATTEALGRYLLSGTYHLNAGRVSWHKVPMRAGTSVYLRLSGDGSTDLDMYVLDAFDNQISSSTGYGDDEAVDLDIYDDGYFWIEVVNHGDYYNNYTITAVEY